MFDGDVQIVHPDRLEHEKAGQNNSDRCAKAQTPVTDDGRRNRDGWSSSTKPPFSFRIPVIPVSTTLSAQPQERRTQHPGSGLAMNGSPRGHVAEVCAAGLRVPDVC